MHGPMIVKKNTNNINITVRSLGPNDLLQSTSQTINRTVH